MINDSCLNHILFADDLCCFSPFFTGLQYLVNVLNAYVSSHDTVFRGGVLKDVLGLEDTF